eukprot:scaffold3794_cov158-Pinguiococcus_pyrenoidosus.AAC.1
MSAPFRKCRNGRASGKSTRTSVCIGGASLSCSNRSFERERIAPVTQLGSSWKSTEVCGPEASELRAPKHAPPQSRELESLKGFASKNRQLSEGLSRWRKPRLDELRAHLGLAEERANAETLRAQLVERIADEEQGLRGQSFHFAT